MLQNPVHVVTHLALNKQLHYFSFLDLSSDYYASIFLKNFISSAQIFSIPSYIETKNHNYEY